MFPTRLSPNVEPAAVRRPPGWFGLRAAIDGLACLALAVLMLRTFLVEGYMISTGSMAPALYGYHKRVVCPTCGETFARGVAFDGSSARADDEDDLFGGGHHAVCPNCGQSAIDVAGVPRNHGDQLLVLKHAYDFQAPRRWEVVVFRNPNHPTQAFVKRVAGLAGEQVRLIDGDVYADGRICRKPLESQRAMRIPVYESDHGPNHDPRWKPRWQRDAGWHVEPSADGRRFTFAATGREAAATSRTKDDSFSWLTYQHRIRSGGSHETSVKVQHLPLEFDWSAMVFSDSIRLELDPDVPGSGTLSAVGAVTKAWEQRLRAVSDHPQYRAAVTKLVENSRLAPITDDYAYNRSVGLTGNVVRDLMAEFRLHLDGDGSFAVEMTDGYERFRLLFDTSSRTVTLLQNAAGEPLRSASLPSDLQSPEGAVVEMSVMDRQVLVAIDGVEPFAAWTYDRADSPQGSTSSPVRLGASGLAVRVESPALYRDVYYTRGKSRNGVEKPFSLNSSEFFVLGDNSPVSLDSRSWPDGAVPVKFLLGKPFVVHLPSRPGTLRVGNQRFTVRVPDFSRMRYIR